MPKKILLADDSITIQKVVELTFSDGDYEVIAVNNGAKAIQKLSEIRPDIILSDIIMPEKNGYEVCEYVKSHPEFRTIPVVLLTGTFEPFDPDRADKAGCDAVVTKPFESQSLIHKVEELIQQGQSAPAAAPASPWAEAPAAPAFETPASPPAAAPASDPFGQAPEPHDSDIFGAASPPAGAADMPFETAAPEAFSGETRAFPRMSFEDLQKMAGETAPAAPTAAPTAVPPPAPGDPEASPWDEQPAFSGETRAFQRMSFDDLQKMGGEPATPAPPPAPPAEEASPWEEAPATPSGGGFSSFEDVSAAAPAPEPEPAAPWDEQPASAFSGETRAFPRMSFEDLQKMAAETPSTPAPEPPPSAPEPSPWDEQPAASGETRAFPSMSFEDLQKMASTSAPEPEAPRSDSSLWDEPAAAAPAWNQPQEAPPLEPAAASEPFGAAEETSPFGAPLEAAASPLPERAAPAETAPAAAASVSGDLTDEQIERIARRVVQMLSADVIRNIAWEVIPDMAEMVVKERIRQLEAEG